MESIRVLLIEDNADDASLIQLVLEKKIKNLSVTHLDSFQLFKEIITTTQFDIVITDYNCGNFTGIDVISELDQRNLDIPIIVVTAEYGMDHALAAISYHVDDYVVKDAKYVNRLPEIVTRVLKNSKLESAIRNTNSNANETLYNYIKMFEKSSDLILSLWKDGSFITTNQTTLDLLGYTVDEINKINIKEIADPDCHIELDHILSETDINKQLDSVELVLLSKSGEKININGNINKRVENGKVVGTHWVVQHLTHSKKSDELLKKQSEQYKSAFEYAPCPMVMGDMRGIVLQINQAACDLVGYTYEEMLGRHIRTITHPLDLLKSLNYHRKLTSGAIDNYTLEKRYRHKDGHYVKVEVTAVLIRNKSGQPRFAIAEFKECGSPLTYSKDENVA